VLEYWSDATNIQYANTPLLHYSNSPVIYAQKQKNLWSSPDTHMEITAATMARKQYFSLDTIKHIPYV
jgi:hypothetical protein